ncbi:LysR substrate-binding domain-containing protein [Asticcacaulis endophyticus]|uniref:LysR substrate-binding domain-containing protein n=1 Tax=Asticcacaulis endophyticus TaxID=1395890 RepID=UPI001676D69C|nr:LysR substrate-binding domain-containing protein [Asticcacaulis endophyticus]
MTGRTAISWPGFAGPDGGLVLQAALRNQGVALIDRILVADDIEAGRLVQVFELSLPYGAYYLVARNFSRLTELAKRFTQWLHGRIAQSPDVSPPLPL